jgi:hypothetical protein
MTIGESTLAFMVECFRPHDTQVALKYPDHIQYFNHPIEIDYL